MKEDKHIKVIAGTLLLLAMLASAVGVSFHDLIVQNVIWQFGNMCSVCGCAIVAAKLNRDGYDLVSAGFCLLVVAEGFIIATTANLHNRDNNMFGAALILYLPGYLLIGIYSRFKWWIRIASLLLCIPFGAEAYFTQRGTPIDPTTFINMSAYILRAIAYVGFAITLFRTKTGEKVY
jgi:hypothetical protein